MKPSENGWVVSDSHCKSYIGHIWIQLILIHNPYSASIQFLFDSGGNLEKNVPPFRVQIFGRLFIAKRNMSFLSLLLFIFNSPIRKLRREFDKRAIARVDTLRDRFTLIYRRNAWGSKESVSGSGSTYAMTTSIRSLLPIIFKNSK